jgi:hypothetical protein
MMTKQNLSKITEVVLLSFFSSSSGCHVERGLRPAIPMDVRSVNVAVGYKRMVRVHTRAWWSRR